MAIYEANCNLFHMTDSSLAHCISADVAMADGIALHFRRNYIGCVDEIRAQGAFVGGVAVLRRKDGRFIYNLVVKERDEDKPTYASLASCLREMRTHAVAHDVGFVALPRFCCGRDGLRWKRVKDLIATTFAGEKVVIAVCGPGVS